MKISFKNKTYRMKDFTNLLGDIVLFLLLMQLLPPQGINEMSPAIQRILWPPHFKTIVAILLAVSFVFFALIKRSIDSKFFVILALPAAAGILTVLHGVSLYGWSRNYLIIVVAAVVIQLYKTKIVRLVRVFRLYLEILIVLNLVFIIMFPSGAFSSRVYRDYNWLLGYKSSIQCYMLPYICLEWLDSYYSNKKLKFDVMLILCVTEAILSKNSMLAVGMILLVLLWIFNIPKKLSALNGNIYAIAYGAINILFIFFINVLADYNWFKDFLSIFGKTSALSGRVTSLWPKSLKMISENWFIGHGVYLPQTYTQLFRSLTAPHAHNQILQILLDGGVVLLVIYFAWILYSSYVLKRNIGLMSSNILMSCTFVIYVMATVEVFIYGTTYFGTWLVLILGLYAKEIDRQYRALPESRW